MKAGTSREAAGNSKRLQLFGFALCAMLFAFSVFAEAQPQQPKKVPRIGYLNDSSLAAFEKLRADAFRQGLRELGHEEGKNLLIEWRYGQGKPDPTAARELVRLKVDVIVTAGGGSPVLPRKQPQRFPLS